MNNNGRPISVTIVAWLYIAVGVIGFIGHLIEFMRRHDIYVDTIEVEAVELVAIVSGIFLLRGRNWARRLAIAWIVFHVVVSAFDALPKLLAHAVFGILIAWALFHRRASEYFVRRAPTAVQ
jgi:hypothetical protein